MKDTWDMLLEIFEKKYPKIIETLNDGATESDFLNLENVVGQELPQEFKEFYSVHNGQVQTHLSLFDGDFLLSTDRIVVEWKAWNNVLREINKQAIEEYDSKLTSEPETGIKNDWWNQSWIPITSNGCGDNYCIDMDPTYEGKKGQIIRMWHDDARRELIAPSFKEWIEKYFLDLRAGKYEFSDSIGWGGLLKKK